MDEIREWQVGLTMLFERTRACFKGRLSWERMGVYVRGLLSSVERKNGWQLAEEAGEKTPYGMQQFLFRGGWDPGPVMVEVRRYLVEHLGDDDGVLVGDETGFLKKGTRSVGVQRQYSGTAGRVENCQIAVFLGYASEKGRSILDRELYLPRSWTDDPERCRAAGVPEDVSFHTKPQLLQTMIARALSEGTPARWVAADAVYGDDPALRSWLEGKRMGFVMATSVNDAALPLPSMEMKALKDLVSGLPADNWQRLSAGDGSQGPRWYDWQHVILATYPDRQWRRSILVRRKISDPSKIAVYRCFHPVGTTIAELVKVAGARWTIETGFEEAKGQVGLDHYEVRSWMGWYRHISLALLGYAFLVVTKATEDAARRAGEKKVPTLQREQPSSMTAFRISRGLSSP